MFLHGKLMLEKCVCWDSFKEKYILLIFWIVVVVYSTGWSVFFLDMWYCGSGSSLVQVIGQCLMALCHAISWTCVDLSSMWPSPCGIPSHGSQFYRKYSNMSLNGFENYLPKIASYSPKSQGVYPQTTGIVRVYTQRCAYWCPSAKAPGPHFNIR